MTYKNYKNEIGAALNANTLLSDVVRKFYLVHPAYAFHSDFDNADKVLNSVSNFLKVPISDIHVCGSAKLGFSVYKNTTFQPGISDLDLAIINRNVFINYFDSILKESRNYTREELFNNIIQKKRYIKMLAKGIINPQNMPNTQSKLELLNFFQSLSIDFRSKYNSISICLYLSETAFKEKQINGLNRWKNDFFPTWRKEQ